MRASAERPHARRRRGSWPLGPGVNGLPALLADPDAAARERPRRNIIEVRAKLDVRPRLAIGFEVENTTVNTLGQDLSYAGAWT